MSRFVIGTPLKNNILILGNPDIFNVDKEYKELIEIVVKRGSEENSIWLVIIESRYTKLKFGRLLKVKV